MNKKFVCYTVIVGDYDELSAISVSSKKVDFICITDNKNLNTKGWKVQYIDMMNVQKKAFLDRHISGIVYNKKLVNSHINRLIKLFPHEFFYEYEGSMYIDGRVIIKKDPSKLISEALKKNAWFSFGHRKGGNGVHESKRCYWSGKIGFMEYLKYRKKISGKDFLKIPLTENGLIIRLHNNKNIKLMSDNWWRLYSKGPYRDQLHWQEAAYITNLKFSIFKFNFNNNPYVTLGQHKNKSSLFNYIIRRLIIL